MTVKALAKAWQDAAVDLGVILTAPFQLLDVDNGVNVESVAWLEMFGSSLGVVVLGRHAAPKAVVALAGRGGRYCSLVDENAYGRYDRGLFIATLNDWGWYGPPAGAPDWYSGEFWGG